MAALCAGLVAPAALPAQAAAVLSTAQAEAMTADGGCTSLEADRAVYYCNNDSTYATHTFDRAGRYRIEVTGASSAANTAGISVSIGGRKTAALSFSGTAWSEQEAVFDIAAAGPGEVRFTLETDNGSNDTYLDEYTLTYEGPTPPTPPAPVPPSTGAYASGEYRNLFQEWDGSLTDAAVRAKLDTYWNSFFTSTDDTRRLYYPSGSNADGPMAYIRDTGNGDVRSEGISYGMMIAVQMGKKAEFDAMWNWAKTYMQHKSGARAGYFCWQATYSGSCQDNNPATDGEEYFATALFFAGHRWGDGQGIYDYTDEANAILDVMLHKEDMNGGVVESVTNMFNRTHKMPVFVPYANSATFSDPSYHLPAFYELWARWAEGYQDQQAADRQFWREAARTSRAYFAKVTHPTTGLNPDYAEFNGTPNNTGNHGDFRFDAWRTSMNWAVDHAWWAADNTAVTLTNRLQTFFESEGINAYVNQYSLAGNPLSSDRSPGLIATNGAASLSATHSRAWQYVEQLWNLQPPTGQYRYYDGLLNFMALLHASGNFRIYHPDGAPDEPPADTAPAAPGSLTATPGGALSITLKWSDNAHNETGFRVERRTGSGSWTQLASPAAGTTTHTDTGLTAGTAYTYRIKAVNAVGESAWSNEATATATATPRTRDAYATLEAESYDASSGVTTRSDDSGTVVHFTGSGSHIALSDVQFGTTSAGSVRLRAATTASGVNVHVRLGSATVSPACTVYPDGNGTWHLKANSCYPKPTGTHTVYITTTGAVTLNHLTFIP
ncbi:glycosyl hydrolase family 8 [Streptomyces sp. TRM 70361]|uniref:glycosyl hydrolase family 8 n=1 Tax=Streptomyces sp. TRM 70361 TaxID=3116553 RepID=UPI002E7BB4A3|nr:glycosyl hydrolase family 8 [Streptomyces sp. TRM 70361]MEE1940673.1 glycosyl hydrolase family 8 [Streptomyces sp. TRM 70361]